MHGSKSIAFRVVVLAALAATLQPARVLGSTLPDPLTLEAAARWLDRTVALVESAHVVNMPVSSPHDGAEPPRREDTRGPASGARSCPNQNRPAEDDSAAARYARLLRAR